MKKWTVTFLLVFTCLFGFTACEKLSEEDKQVIKELQSDLLTYTNFVKELEEKYKQGKIGEKEFIMLKANTEALIHNTTAKVKELEDTGIDGWTIGWEFLKTLVITFATRGLPSKGPLSIIRVWAGGTTRDKK